MNNPLPRFRFVLESFRNIFLVECIEAKLNNPYKNNTTYLDERTSPQTYFRLHFSSNQISSICVSPVAAPRICLKIFHRSSSAVCSRRNLNAQQSFFQTAQTRLYNSTLISWVRGKFRSKFISYKRYKRLLLFSRVPHEPEVLLIILSSTSPHGLFCWLQVQVSDLLTVIFILEKFMPARVFTSNFTL